MSTKIQPMTADEYRSLLLQSLDRRIDYEREANDPNGAALGLEWAYRMIISPMGDPRPTPPGQTVLSGSYAPDRVLEDGVPAVLQAMLQGAQFGRTVRVTVEEVFGS